MLHNVCECGVLIYVHVFMFIHHSADVYAEGLPEVAAADGVAERKDTTSSRSRPRDPSPLPTGFPTHVAAHGLQVRLCSMKDH